MVVQSTNQWNTSSQQSLVPIVSHYSQSLKEGKPTKQLCASQNLSGRKYESMHGSERQRFVELTYCFREEILLIHLDCSPCWSTPTKRTRERSHYNKRKDAQVYVPLTIILIIRVFRLQYWQAAIRAQIYVADPQITRAGAKQISSWLPAASDSLPN